MIYLFGDSFVYRDKVEKLGIRDYPRWQDILSDQCDEENFNFGENGEGSYETMHKFCNLFEKKYFRHHNEISYGQTTVNQQYSKLDFMARYIS